MQSGLLRLSTERRIWRITHQGPAIISKHWWAPFLFLSALHCCNVLVELVTVLVTHRTTVLLKEVQKRTFLCPGSKIFLAGHILWTQWCALSLLSHSHRKQGNLVYPSCSPSESAMTFRSAQMFHFYFMYCSNGFMLSFLSSIPNACETGMECNTFSLCRRTALRLTLEESMSSLHSSEQWLMINALNKPSTSLHATRVPSMVKNSSRYFLAITIQSYIHAFIQIYPLFHSGC